MLLTERSVTHFGKYLIHCLKRKTKNKKHDKTTVYKKQMSTCWLCRLFLLCNKRRQNWGQIQGVTLPVGKRVLRESSKSVCDPSSGKCSALCQTLHGHLWSPFTLFVLGYLMNHVKKSVWSDALSRDHYTQMQTGFARTRTRTEFKLPPRIRRAGDAVVSSVHNLHLTSFWNWPFRNYAGVLFCSRRTNTNN